MNQKTLVKLEYNKIIELLENQASSESGKMRCRNLKPMIDLEEITIGELIGLLSATADIEDIKISSTPIEDIIKEILKW